MTLNKYHRMTVSISLNFERLDDDCIGVHVENERCTFCIMLNVTLTVNGPLIVSSCT